MLRKFRVYTGVIKQNWCYIFLKIAKIFNDTTLDRKAIDDFYGDWLLSPSVKLGDLPFFTGIMASETLVKTLKTSDEDSAKNMWEQTVAEQRTSRMA